MGSPGEPKTGGRKKGTKNRFNAELRFELKETLREQGFDPIIELIRVNREAWKEYDRASEIFDAIQSKRADYGLVPLSESTAPTYLRLAQDSAKDILPYLLPRLKHVELTGAGGKDFFQSFSQLMTKLEEKDKVIEAKAVSSELLPDAE